MKSFSDISITIALAAGTIGSLLFGWVFYVAFTEAEPHFSIVSDLYSQLGFTSDSQYLEEGGEVPVITAVTPGGIMEKAGFETNDRIGEPYSNDTFIYTLLLNQGKRISFPIIRNGEQQKISLNIPVLRLSHDPNDIHWKFPFGFSDPIPYHPQ